MKRFNLFPVADGQTLGILRFAFFILVFFYLTPGDYFLHWKNVPAELWAPQALTSFLNPSQEIPWTAIYMIWKVSLILSAFGIFSRWVLPLTAALSFLLIGHAQSFGYFTRLYMPILWAIVILAFSHCGDHFSLDNFIRRWRKASLPESRSQEYGWPIQMIRILFCVVFFSAGLSKIVEGGWDRIFGETLRNTFLKAWIWNQELKPGDTYLGALLYTHPLLSKFLQAGSVALELFTPLALFWRRPQIAIILGLIVMQWTIRQTIFVSFAVYSALYIFWIPNLLAEGRVANFATAKIYQNFKRKLVSFTRTVTDLRLN